MTDFAWIAIELSDVGAIALAFALGLLSKRIGLPPLVGFLVAGLLLGAYSAPNADLLQKLADLGITLLLFTIGLKLSLRILAQPQVWAVAGLHMTTVVIVFGLAIYALAATGISMFSALNLHSALLIAFSLSFSSTVFVVKVLEARGEMTSLRGRISVGILLIQDVVAVAFLAASTAKTPSLWALLLILIVPLKTLIHRVLTRIDHGELLVLFGFLLALGGAEVFELVGLKGDLGALVLGVLVASHARADEMAKSMLGFKDLFLLGFFLSIGLAGQPSWSTLGVAALLTLLVAFKSGLFFLLLTQFKLRARTSLLAALSLSNYSEFGLIVAAIGVANGWISNDWLVTIAIAVALSFVLAAALDAVSAQLYTRHKTHWQRFQKPTLIADEQSLDLGGATIAIIGMGRVGIGAYDAMREQYGDTVVGIDIDPVTARIQKAAGRSVFRGDPSDADFWDRVQATHTLKLAMLTIPKARTAIAVYEQLKAASFDGPTAAVARFPNEVDVLKNAGVNTVFNIYQEAGSGFAAHVARELEQTSPSA